MLLKDKLALALVRKKENKVAGCDFALNHSCAPSLPLPAFLALSKSVGVSKVEIRNDLAGLAIMDGSAPGEVKALAAAAGVEIATINALQKFNHWSDERAKEAEWLASYAAACGAKALVLVAANDGSGCEDGVRQINLRAALTGLAPILKRHNILGLVEPLGYETCSLRLKSEAVEAIVSLKLENRFQLLHDTFHHFIAGEEAIFPEYTALVHISGVTDKTLKHAEMRDSNRVLVTHDDRIGTIGQIKVIGSVKPDILLSFEPFSLAVHNSRTLDHDLRQSMALVSATMA